MPIRVLAGPSPTSLMHVAVVNVGDLDGDGVPDVGFASQQLADGWLSFASTRTGDCLRVVHGWSWGVITPRRVGSSAPQMQLEVFRDPFFGSWLKRAGDIDGDGIDDMLVGAGQDYYGTGHAWIISGLDCSPIGKLELGENSRRAANGVGDLDGSGFAHLAYDSSDPWSRGVSIVSGRSLEPRAPSASIVVDDDGFGLYVVEAIEPAGDVDRGGCDDLMVSVICSNDPGPPGCVLLVSGKDRKTIRRYDTLSALAALNSKH